KGSHRLMQKSSGRGGAPAQRPRSGARWGCHYALPLLAQAVQVRVVLAAEQGPVFAGLEDLVGGPDPVEGQRWVEGGRLDALLEVFGSLEQQTSDADDLAVERAEVLFRAVAESGLGGHDVLVVEGAADAGEDLAALLGLTVDEPVVRLVAGRAILVIGPAGKSQATGADRPGTDPVDAAHAA